MSLKVGDRIRQNTLSTGVGGVSLVGDIPGFKRFSDVLSSGDITYYVIEENDKFEVGVGIYGSDNLERFHVLSSSNSGNKIELGGSGAVFVTYPADKSVIRDLESQVVVGASGLIFENGTTFKEAKVVELADVNLEGSPSSQYLIDFNTTNKSLVIGESAGPSNSRNTLIGHGAGSGITSGTSNTNIGTDAGHKNEQGFKNVSIGDLAGPSDENASISVSRTVNVGYQAGEKSRDDSVNIGFQAGAAAYSRGHVSIGSFSGSGVGNYAFVGGYEAAHNHQGDYLIAIGYRAAKDGGGESSVWVGKQAGQGTSSAINSIGIGELSGQDSSGNNSIYLGKKSGKGNTLNDMLFVAGNGPTSEGTLIKGDFNTKRLAVGKSDVTLSDTFYVGVNSSTDNGIVVQGASLQSSDLTQWRTYDGQSIASVSNSGTLLVNGLSASGQGLRLDSSTPIITGETLYNVNGSLYWNGASLSDQISYASGLAIVNEADIAYVSGVIENNTSDDAYVSGIAVYSSGQAITNQVDISYVSGVAVYASGNVYDDSYISGVAVYSSGQTIANQVDISYVSGVAAYASGNVYDDSYISGVAVYSSGQAIQNELDIAYVSGIAAHGHEVSEEDLIYVSGIAVYASGNIYDDTYVSGVATYSSGVLVDGGTLIPDADKGIAIAKGSENFPVTITQDDNFSGGAYYIRLRDNDTDNITLGATDLDAFQITASGEGSSGAENIFKFSSAANDDHLVFGGSTVPTKVLGSNVTVNAEGSVELQRGGSTRVRGDSAFTYLFGQTGGYIFYGANALKPQSATSIALGGASNYWGSLYSSDANLKGSAATNVPLTIDSQPAQSANLAEFKANDGVVVAQVAPDGSIATSGDISSSGTVYASSISSKTDVYPDPARIRLDGIKGYLYGFNGNVALDWGHNAIKVYKTLQAVDNTVNIGTHTSRWSNVYSLDGDFSNTVSASGVTASGTVTANTIDTTWVRSNGNLKLLLGVNGFIYYDNLRPNANGTQSVGLATQRFGNFYGVDGDFSNTVSSSGVQASGMLLYSHTPTDTSNKLYNNGGTLMFNGSAVDSGQVSGSASGVAFFGNDGLLTDDSSFVFNSGSQELELSSISAHKTQSCDSEGTGNQFRVDLTSDNSWLNNQYANNFTSKILGDGASNQVTNIHSALEFRDSAHTGSIFWGTNSKVLFYAPVSMGSNNRVIGLEGGFNNGHFCSFLGTHLVGVRAYNSFNYNPTVNSSTKFVGFKSEVFGTSVSGVAEYRHFWATDTNFTEIGNSYGMYIEEQTKGATGNYSIYTAGGLSEFNGRVSVVSDSSTQVPFAVNSAVSQSANLTEWRASDDVVIAQVEPDGSISTSGNVNVSGVVRSQKYLPKDDTVKWQIGHQDTRAGIEWTNNQYSMIMESNYGQNLTVANGYTSIGKQTFPLYDSTIPLGIVTRRWSDFYSVSGSFSGDLNVEPSGSFKVYNLGDSHTNTTNTEYGGMWWDTNACYIGNRKSGTGANRPLYFAINGSARWAIATDGGLIPVGSRTFGTNGSRPLTVFSVDGDFSGSVSGARGFFESSTTTDSALTITSAVSQTANLTEWKNSSDETITKVTSDGSVHVSGNIVSEQVGEIRNYILGKPGDTDTEYLKIGDLSGIVHHIKPQSTGSGQNRHIRIESADSRGKLNLYSDGHLNYFFNNNQTFSAFHWGISVSGEIRNLQSSNPSSLGNSSSPFGNVYSQNGSFSGDLNIEPSGSQKFYNLGTDGDTDTEFVSMSWDSNDFKLLTDKTGTGTIQDLDIAGKQVALKHNSGTSITTRLSVDSNSVKVWRNLYGGTDGLYNCGLPANRWLGVYSVNGDFSGDVTTGTISGARGFFESATTTDSALTITSAVSQTANLQEWRASDDVVIAQVEPDGSIASSGDISSSGTITGDSYKIYNVGGDGDTVTEYLELVTEANNYKIQAEQTGGGTIRPIFLDGHSVRFNTSGNARMAVLSNGVYNYVDSVPNADGSVYSGQPNRRWAGVFSHYGEFSNTVSSSGVQASGLLLYDHAPTVTTNTLYNDGGTLMFNGSAVGGGGSVTGTPSGVAFFGDDGSLTDHTDLITSSGTNGRRIGINSTANAVYQLTVGNQVYNQSAIAEIKNYSRGNSILQIVATSGGRSANIKYSSGSADWYQGHLQASMAGLGGRFVVASYELDNTKPLVYDSNGDFVIGGMAPSARLTVNSRGTTTVNTVFKATALQTANMAEWRASDGVVIAKVAADGSIASSGTVSATNLNVFASGAVGDTDSESLKISSDGTTYDIFSTPTGAGSHRRIDIGGFDGAAYRGLRLDTTNGIFEWQYNNATKFKVDATTCNISSTTTVTNDIRSDNHRPLTDKTYDSGETGYRWANVYAASGSFSNSVIVNHSGIVPTAALDVYGDPVAVNRTVARFRSSTGAEVLNIYNGNSDTTPVTSLNALNTRISLYNGVEARKTSGTGTAFRVKNAGDETKFRVDTDGEVALGSSASLYTYTNLATLDVIPKSTSFPGIAVIANAAQTANLQEWKASDEVNVATVAPDGSIASSGNISASGNITTQGELLTDLIRGEVYFKNNASNHIIVDASQTGTNNAKMTSRGNRFIITAENGFGNNLGYLVLNGEGGTYLQYDGADKLSTTSTGVSVDGHFTATSKSFLIDHPTKKDAKLQYASLEGPEHGVYVRGRVTENVIELPDHWAGLVDEESITVQLTAKGHPQPNMFVSSIVNNKVYISSDVEVDAFYNVYAERKDVDKLEVEIWQ